MVTTIFLNKFGAVWNIWGMVTLTQRSALQSDRFVSLLYTNKKIFHLLHSTGTEVLLQPWVPITTSEHSTTCARRTYSSLARFNLQDDRYTAATVLSSCLNRWYWLLPVSTVLPV
jgi:hypothetical protein